MWNVTQHVHDILSKYVICIWGGTWLAIRAAALPVSCHGSVLLRAGMKVTEDDKLPNAFSPAADFWCAGEDKWERGGSNYRRGRPSACACGVTLGVSCPTVHVYLVTATWFVTKQSKCKRFDSQGSNQIEWSVSSHGGYFITIRAFFNCVHV